MGQQTKYKVTWKSGDTEILTSKNLQEAHRGFAGKGFFCKDLKKAIRYIEAEPGCNGLTLTNGIKIERI